MVHVENAGVFDITAFGIRMSVLRPDDLDMLCRWRNSDNVRLFLEDSRIVTPQTMNVWFQKVKQIGTTYPYIVFIQGNPIAYTELKNVDTLNSTCEGGLFFSEKKYIGTGIGYKIVLCRELVMARLGIRTLISRVHASNTRSIHFCVGYGGEYSHSEEDFLLYVYRMQHRREKLKKIACILRMESEFILQFGE